MQYLVLSLSKDDYHDEANYPVDEWSIFKLINPM